MATINNPVLQVFDVDIFVFHYSFKVVDPGHNGKFRFTIGNTNAQNILNTS